MDLHFVNMIEEKYQCIICSPNSKAFCQQCRIFHVTKSTNYFCSYCNPDKPTIQKTKENRVKKFLEENNYIYLNIINIVHIKIKDIFQIL